MISNRESVKSIRSERKEFRESRYTISVFGITATLGSLENAT